MGNQLVCFPVAVTESLLDPLLTERFFFFNFNPGGKLMKREKVWEKIEKKLKILGEEAGETKVKKRKKKKIDRGKKGLEREKTRDGKN